MPYNTLVSSVDFWLRHGMDKNHGGIYTCLDRSGNVFSTDKSVWMQGRAAYTFARFARLYPGEEMAKPALEAAIGCVDFAERYCRDRARRDRLFFSVTEDGMPLRRRRYHFSEAFLAMGSAQLYRLTGETRYLGVARRNYSLVHSLESGASDPFSIPPKTDPQTRSVSSLAVPMIRLNLAMEMEEADVSRAALYRSDAADAVERILKLHFHPELGATLESVPSCGVPLTGVSEGRLVSPGHSAECAGFLLRYARRTGDGDVLSSALAMLRLAVEGGWDDKYGGLYYFIDCEGKDVDLPEHSMKLWWPHTDALSALHLASQMSEDEAFPGLFYKVKDWAFSHFPDPVHGEWYGYLHRSGEISSYAKGGIFKGPFHLPRAMMALDGKDG